MNTDNASATPEIHIGLESLPSPPVVAMEIVRLTQDEGSDAADLARVLAQDPVLATRILQVANSPAYGLGHEVSSVGRATALLGLKAVKMMALSFSLAADLDGAAGALSVEQYWYSSLLNAVTARRWAELLAPGLTEEAFLAGLLSHLGRLVLARQRPAEFAEAVALCGDDWPGHAAERDVFGFSSADVTGVVMEKWGLPRIIVEATGAMYCGKTPSEEVNGAAALADVLGQVVMTEAALCGAYDRDAFERLQAEVAAAGIPEAELEEFVLDLETRVREMAEMLDVEIPAGMSHQAIVDQARATLIAVSLEAVQSLETVEQQAEQLRASNAELEDKAFVDRLTSVANRAAFDDHLSRAIAGMVRREQGTVGLLMFDIDHFKAFNDTYGHQLGDEVLRRVAGAMDGSSRSDELFARYGGEEFALVAVDCTAADLFITGERLRKAVEAVRVPSEAGTLAVTVSAGAAILDKPFDRGASERLIKLADEALYEAKENGRNQVRVAS